jgi:hypothetical protein
VSEYQIRRTNSFEATNTTRLMYNYVLRMKQHCVCNTSATEQRPFSNRHSGSQKTPIFMELRRSLSCLQQLHTNLYMQSCKPTSSHPISLKLISILFSHLRLSLVSVLFPHVFPTNLRYTTQFPCVLHAPTISFSFI